ncbi:PQQ-binding-like beta-propeller repeat protein [Ruania rhizosphaerae]|uniref:outer membrane protein assembly factor BamB family protein n=1 Tax=Ruania rhizosphaerae TaxID=1840413 RepID=UPI00135BBE3F|nr:PQQ-binding-like beta-propeller repeat protein [Ruania rhizosphaerae]
MRPTDEFEPAPTSPTSPEAARRRPQVWSRPWPWAVLAVLLVVAAVLTVPRPGPVVDPWGYLPNLHDEPELAWETDLTADAFWLFSRAVVARGPDGVTGLDSASGEEIWSIQAEEPTCTSDGVDLTCTTGPDTVEVIDPRSGRARPYEVPGVAAAASVDRDIVAVTTHDIRRVNGSGRLIWRSEIVFGRAMNAPPELIHSTVAVSSIRSGSTLLDAETGNEVSVPDAGRSPHSVRDGLWRSTDLSATWLYVRDDPSLAFNGWISERIATPDPTLIRAIDEKELDRWRPVAFLPEVTLGFLTIREHGPGVLIAEAPDTGEELWRTGPEVSMWDPPLLGPETFLYSDSTELIALDVSTGSTRWTIAPQDVILDFSSDGERLYILDETGVSGWDLS